MTRLVYIGFGCLVTASLMWPSEGAIHGNGGHLNALWLLLAGFMLLVTGRASVTQKPGRAIIPVLLLVAGFWVSTWHVFDVGTDRRAAVNLAFTWTALGSAWWLTAFIARHCGSQLVLALLVSIGVGASVQGICQHHVVYR